MTAAASNTALMTPNPPTPACCLTEKKRKKKTIAMHDGINGRGITKVMGQWNGKIFIDTGQEITSGSNGEISCGGGRESGEKNLEYEWN